jgi:hypothetical protein
VQSIGSFGYSIGNKSYINEPFPNFGNGFEKSGQKPAFSTKSKVAFPKVASLSR